MKKLLLLSAVLLSVLFTGCEKGKASDPLLNNSEIALKFTETHQLIVSNTSEKPVWSSENNFVASVSSDGLITAKHIGETNIFCNLSGVKLTCKVTVNKKHDLYTEPLLDFGASKSSIKGKETRMLDSESSTSLVYKDPKAKVVEYIFENNKMKSAMVGLSLYTNQDDLAGFLTERYDVVGTDGEIIALQNDKVLVGLTVMSGSYVILYIPKPDKNSSPLKELRSKVLLSDDDKRTVNKELFIEMQSIFNKHQ